MVTYSIRFVICSEHRQDKIASFCLEAQNVDSAMEEAARVYGRFYPKTALIFAFTRFTLASDVFTKYITNERYGM